MHRIVTSRDVESKSPVAWARWGLVSRLLAAAVRPQGPPVLIVSMPRSGSSWVGDMMGSAPEALYLREPITQGDPRFYTKGTVVAPDDPEISPSFRRLADTAFLGWPDFPEKIVRDPGRWALADRARRRLVIKEVNPRALAWYLDRHRPRLVFLVRHPAAVASSFVKQGWMEATPEYWPDNGKFQGIVLSEAWRVVSAYPAFEVVSYEQLCVDPLGHFARLFDFAGLTLDGAMRDQILYYSQDNERRIDSWRDEVPPESARALRESYRVYGVPWYQDDAAW